MGRGRVWTGGQAKPLKLIDEFGGIAEAIDEAKRAAGLSKAQKAQIVMLPKTDTGLLERVIGGAIPGLGKSGSGGGGGFTLNDLLPGAAEIQRCLREAETQFSTGAAAPVATTPGAPAPA